LAIKGCAGHGSQLFLEMLLATIKRNFFRTSFRFRYFLISLTTFSFVFRYWYSFFTSLFTRIGAVKLAQEA